MKISYNVITAAVVASLALTGCSDSDDGDSSNPSTTTAKVTLVDTSNTLQKNESFPHSVVNDGYVVTYIDNTGNEYQTTDVSLNAPFEITFEGSAMITVSHPQNIDGVQVAHVLASDELSVNSDADIEVPMYNKDWQAISIDCLNVNAATLGVVTQQCDQNDSLNFYQRGSSHDLFVSFEDGFTPYALQDKEVIVGDHHHITFDLAAAQNSTQSNDLDYQSSAHWNYIPHTIPVGNDELEQYVGKNLDEVTLHDGYMEVASYATALNQQSSEDPILTSKYNVITLHGLQEKPGYPLSAYKEPKVRIENHSGIETGFMNLYLNNDSKANVDELAFVIEFNTDGTIKNISSADHNYSSWQEFTTAHGNQLVNSSYMMNDLDMTSIANCVLDFGPQSNNLNDFLSELIDEECTRSLMDEIQQDGIEHIHLGNFFWRSNDTTNIDEVRLDVYEFEVGLISDTEPRSSVHQSNSRGFDNFEFSNSQTQVTWETSEPKVWIKDIPQGLTLSDSLVSNLTSDLQQNEDTYINIYLTDGNLNKCVTLFPDSTFSITTEATDTATCTGANEAGLTLDLLESKTSGFTVRTDYFDVLDKGNFFWRGKEKSTTEAVFTDYSLVQ